MAHPQSSPRGYISKARVDVGAKGMTGNSTGTVFSGAVYASAQTTGGKITANSTAITLGGGLVVTGTLAVSNQATIGLLSANSTALILPNSVRVGAKTTYFSSNSTGVKLGARYVSTNTTGNSTT